MLNIRLGIIAHPGSGKSTCGDYLVKERGHTMFEGSAHLSKTAKELGITLRERSDYAAFHQRMQQEHGLDWLGRQFLTMQAAKAVHIGVRALRNVQLLQEGGGYLIALDCPEEIAFARMDKTSPKSPQTLDEYRAHCLLDDSPNIQITRSLNRADFRIDTSQPEAVMFSALDRIVEELESQRTD